MEFEIRFERLVDTPFSDDAIRAHIARLARLDDEGRLIAAGPFADDSGGLILARFDSLADAEAFARSDPFVAEGYETFSVRSWEHAHRGNGYLGREEPSG